MPRLERSATNRAISGVCGGLAEYLQVDATWIRLLFVIVAVFTAGIGVLAYIVLLILMPLPGQPPLIGTAPAEGAPTAGESPRPAVTVDPERGRTIAAYVLIALGLVFLLGNLGLFWFASWRYVWPLVLVALGVLLLVQRARR